MFKVSDKLNGSLFLLTSVFLFHDLIFISLMMIMVIYSINVKYTYKDLLNEQLSKLCLYVSYLIFIIGVIFIFNNFSAVVFLIIGLIYFMPDNDIYSFSNRSKKD